MAAQLLCTEQDGTLSFGNHKLEQKAKQDDFEHGGDIYKVKTYATMTKLEKNGLFLYESVPGTSVSHFQETADGVSFEVEGADDAQLIIGLCDDTQYEVFVAGKSAGKMNTDLGGKLNVSVELAGMGEVNVKVVEV